MALQYADVTGDLFEIEPPSEDAEVDSSTPAVLLRVHLQPGAGASSILGRRGDSLAIRVAPPSSSPMATTAAMAFLSGLLDLDASAIELQGGERGPEKRFRISGVDPTALRRQLDEEISRAGRGGGSARGARPAR